MGSLKQVARLEHSSDVGAERTWSVRWNHNGVLLGSCGENKSLRIWRRSSEKFELLTTLKDHERAVRYLDFSPCGNYVASVGFDAVIIVYQFENGDFEEVTRMEGHENEVKCCTFSPSGRFLASCSRDKSVWFWQMDEDDDFQVCSILQPHTGDVKFVTWHPSEEVLVSCSYDASIKFYRFDGEDWVTQQRIENAHESTVWSAAFDAEGNYLATVGADHRVNVWKRIFDDSTTSVASSSWKKVVEYDVPNCIWPLYSVSWNHFNDMIAVGGGDSRVRLIQFDRQSETVTEVFSLKVDDEVNSVAWNPKEPTLLATGTDDGFVTVFELC
uniref:Probable cytosolic iron-sulfur protein assembly protein CIAO1 homolog n=1 Tax=Steinernema glaseri TaxID=37863 RepID=A0A1I7ZCW3_9BILA